MNNIKYYRTLAGLNQSQLAKLSELDRTLIGKLETGKRRLNQDNMKKIADALGIKPEDLIREGESLEENDNIVSLPFYSYLLSAGNGYQTFEEEATNTFKIIKSKLEEITNANNNNLISFKITADGDSMMPKIMPNDTVLLDKSVTKIINESIYAFVIDETFYLKRLQKLPNKIKVISDNHKYDSWYIEEDQLEHLKIIGLLKGRVAYESL